MHETLHPSPKASTEFAYHLPMRRRPSPLPPPPSAPKSYQLKVASGMLHPLWLSAVGSGRHSLTVSEDGTLTLKGEQLEFVSERLAPGTPVQVWMRSYIYAATEADCTAHALALKAHEREIAQAQAKALDSVRDEAAAFYRTLALPFAWTIGVKQVRSGLTERSFGDGANRNSVTHIQFTEDFAQGRLVRARGEYLCTTDRGAMGVLDSEAADPLDSAGKPFKPIPTCKTCVKMLARWMHPG